MKKKLLLRPRKSPNKLSINGKRFQEKMVMLFRKKASEKNGGFKPKKSGLRKRLLRSFGILMILTAIIAIFNYFVLNNFSKDTENLVKEEVKGLIANEKLRFNIAERISLINQFLLYGDESIRDRYEEVAKDSYSLQKQLLEVNGTKEMKDLISKCAEWEIIVRNDILFSYDLGRKDEVMKKMREEVQPLGEGIILGFEKIAEERQNEVMDRGNDIISASSFSIMIVVLVSVLAILIGFIASIKMAGSITKPIVSISNRMKEISKGNLVHEPLTTKTKDEIRDLIEAVNDMAEKLRKIVHDISDASATVSQQSNELFSSSKELKEGSTQIAATMQELSVGAESQANSVSELSEAMGMYMKKVYSVQNGSAAMTQKSNQVLDLTNNGSKLMDQSMEIIDKMYADIKVNLQKIQQLDERSKEILKLVDVIQSIADQTNLLALNAAIEAARAGEYGRGFAVVADEVRKLAEQVSNSVVDIQKIVEEVHEQTNNVAKSFQEGFSQVEAGTKSMKDTREAFVLIQQNIKEITESILNAQNELNNIMETSETINESISNIASISEEAAASIEETSASAVATNEAVTLITSRAESMSQLAGKLQALVKQFNA